MAPDTALILVGGFGTRIRHLVPTLPKPLAPVLGRPFLYWILKHLNNQGISRVILLAHYKCEMLHDFVLEYQNPAVQLDVHREQQPLGTGGSLINVLASSLQIPEIFFLLNGDSLLVSDYRVPALFAADDCSAIVFARVVEDTYRYGALSVGDGNRLTSIVSGRSGPGAINSGVYIFKKSALANYQRNPSPLSLENELLPAMLKKGVWIHTEFCDGPFIDIGTESAFKTADLFISNNLQAS